MTEEECLAVRLAALLHDIGHYPFSHALEEAGFPSPREAGRRQAHRRVSWASGCVEIGGPDFPDRDRALIRGTSDSPLQGLISGSLDLDKIDYLSRDARMCGVPYGTVDVDRLLTSLTLVEVGPGRLEVGVHEKGVSALESLLFAKYQMYRNVYWHHAVRSATCMFKRAVRGAVRRGVVTAQAIAEATDDGLMELLIGQDRNDLAGRDPRAAAPQARARPAGERRPRRVCSPGWPTIRTCWSWSRTPWRRRSGCRLVSCCSTSRLARRCSAWTCRSAPGPARSSGSPTRGARDSSGCPGWPTSCTGARGGFVSSWRAARAGRSRRVL